ncbi:hypothetical protein D3C86_1309970 [compost metagenome]
MIVNVTPRLTIREGIAKLPKGLAAADRNETMAKTLLRWSFGVANNLTAEVGILISIRPTPPQKKATGMNNDDETVPTTTRLLPSSAKPADTHMSRGNRVDNHPMIL